MALIELKLIRPSLKRVETTETIETPETSEEHPIEETTPKGRRLFTVRRMLVLAGLVGAFVMVRRMLRRAPEVTETSVEIDEPETPVEA